MEQSPSWEANQFSAGQEIPNTIYKRGVFYSRIKVFDAPPTTIKDISGNPKKFKVVLKNYLLTHSFYNLDEFFSEWNTYVMLHPITLYKLNLYCNIISIATCLLFYNYYSF